MANLNSQDICIYSMKQKFKKNSTVLELLILLICCMFPLLMLTESILFSFVPKTLILINLQRNFWEIFVKLKRKTIHECFLNPYKRQSSMLGFIAFSFSRILVEWRCRLSVPWGRQNYTNYQYIINTNTYVESPHYFAVWFTIVVNASIPIFNVRLVL